MRYAKTLALTLALFSVMTHATEEPSHAVIQADGKIELRQYDVMLVAEVQVDGSMGEASSKGFRALADFIFGNNASAEKIAMTAPVSRERSSKIDMTAPVTREQTGDDTWTVSFVMPEKWTIETLPRPNNPAVTIREEPGKLMATIQFSGLGRMESHLRNQQKLEAWIAQNGFVAIGQPLYAGYDAPWVLPFLRRNEVMIPVEKQTSG